MLLVIQIVSIAVAAVALLLTFRILFRILPYTQQRRRLDAAEGDELAAALREIAPMHNLSLSHLNTDAQQEEILTAIKGKTRQAIVSWMMLEVVFFVAAVIAIVTFIAPEWLGYTPAVK
jgi:hypothetical protein